MSSRIRRELENLFEAELNTTEDSLKHRLVDPTQKVLLDPLRDFRQRAQTVDPHPTTSPTQSISNGVTNLDPSSCFW